MDNGSNRRIQRGCDGRNGVILTDIGRTGPDIRDFTRQTFQLRKPPPYGDHLEATRDKARHDDFSERAARARHNSQFIVESRRHFT
jgi:hypothetical protein